MLTLNERTDVEQQISHTSRCDTQLVQRGAGAPEAEKLTLRFTEAELLRLTGLKAPTLAHWVKRGWVTPVGDVKAPRGRYRYYTAWQAVAFAVIAGAHRAVRGRDRSYLGRTCIVRAMQMAEGRDDAELLSPGAQDAHDPTGRVGEQAAMLANDATPSAELTAESREILGRVVRAIDRKYRNRDLQRARL